MLLTLALFVPIMTSVAPPKWTRGFRSWRANPLLSRRIPIHPAAHAAADVSGSDVEELHLNHNDAELPAYYPAHGAAKTEKADDCDSGALLTDSLEKVRLDEKDDSWTSTTDDAESCAKESWADDDSTESGTERGSTNASDGAGAAEPPPASGLEGLLAREFAAIRDEIQRDLGGAHGEVAADFASIRDEMGQDFATIRQDLASAMEEVRGDWRKVTDLLRSIW